MISGMNELTHGRALSLELSVHLLDLFLCELLDWFLHSRELPRVDGALGESSCDFLLETG